VHCFVMAQGCVPTGQRGKKRTVKIGEMRVELCQVRHAIIVDGQAHRLSELSFRMLDLLVSRSPDPVSFADIERAVWNAQVTRETIKQRVTLLRENLEQIGIEGASIEAVRNHGYRTTLQMSAVAAARPVSALRRIGLAGGVVLMLAAALALAWQQRVAERGAKPLLAVVADSPPSGSDPAAVDALRRDMVRALSRFEGIDVIDRMPATGAAPAYLVRFSLQRSGPDRRLAAELVDGTKGTVLFAEQYDLASSQTDRAVLHFAHNIHAQLGASAASGGELSNEARMRYAEAYRLWRLGDRQSLLGARKSLSVMATEPETSLIARSLLARVQSDLVLRHGEPQSLARQAEQDIRALIVRQPGVGDLRYSLARTLLAQGRRGEALDELRVAVRTMPFLSREILAIERGAGVLRDQSLR
jgi:DNA-binding winged helix-turn-helix (wHTH) protein/TolB-like protein